MRRVMPTWLRITIALSVTMLILWPFTGYTWCIYLLDEDIASPDGQWRPTYISAPATHISLENLQRREDFQDPASLLEATIAVLIALGLYALLTRIFGPQVARETICRRCKQVLRGLIEARCPSCDEAV